MDYSILVETVSILLSIIFFLGWRVSVYTENQQLWTLRLQLSLWQPYFLPLWATTLSAAAIRTIYSIFVVSQVPIRADEIVLSIDHVPRSPISDTHRTIPYVLMSLIALVTAEFAVRVFATRTYLHLRQKAWCGPSRTGISPEMSIYVGNKEDWRSLARHMPRIRPHPVEKFALTLHKNRRIFHDPTDLLRSRAEMDQTEGIRWIPSSTEKSGVYQSGLDNHSISLLWGEDLGFQARCSRGIISIPPYLLTTTPKLRSGLCGKALCLTLGILARNKGLEPRSLICNLKAKNSFRAWEEAGNWPHPAKTLRSFYYTELEKAFSLLGDVYVTAATELALLLADLDSNKVDAWLGNQFEHQDLAFNLQAHTIGATPEDLARIYRGHYAAMLVSLSLVHRHARMRPEVTVFDAVCRLENVKIPDWASSEEIEERRQAERREYGASLQRLISAII